MLIIIVNIKREIVAFYVQDNILAIGDTKGLAKKMGMQLLGLWWRYTRHKSIEP